jgi:hypothetical protein
MINQIISFNFHLKKLVIIILHGDREPHLGIVKLGQQLNVCYHQVLLLIKLLNI